MNDNYRQKIAEYYYTKGLNLAIKEAKLPTISLSNVGSALGEYDAGSSAIAAAKDTSGSKKKNKSVTRKLTDFAKGYAKSKLTSAYDPNLPKNESMKDKLLNVAGDALTIIEPGPETPAALARTVGRVKRMSESNAAMKRKMRASDNKTERDAIRTYANMNPRQSILGM